MGFADQYLSKQQGYNPYISNIPSEHLRFVVVIPAFCETGLTDSLESLWHCDRPAADAEIIIVVNSAENSNQQVLRENQSCIISTSQWISDHQDPSMRFYIMEKMAMPAGVAGVGLARKTGMDEAIYRFNLIGNSNGYILSFDADSQCDTNYFTAIEQEITTQQFPTGFTIYFEHPVSGIVFSEELYQGIIDYELHLRYVNQFLHFTGFPFASHTVGSCFGVRADIYSAQGGMNKRKAGEDFYFLHKIIPLGHFFNIKTTRVIPSPRESLRVPFGTGTAISRYLASEEKEMHTYSPDCFLSLFQFFQQTGKFFKIKPDEINTIINELPISLKNYLLDICAVKAITEINANCSTPDTFRNRFYRWFDAFRVIKYLNFASRDYYKQLPVSVAAKRLLSLVGYHDVSDKCGNLELLHVFRKIERGEGFRL
jgi:hypothetical protein